MRTRKEGGCYIMLANTITVISARIQMSTQHTYPFCRYPFLHPNVTNRHDATASKLCTFTDAVNMALQQCALYVPHFILTQLLREGYPFLPSPYMPFQLCQLQALSTSSVMYSK